MVARLLEVGGAVGGPPPVDQAKKEAGVAGADLAEEGLEVVTAVAVEDDELAQPLPRQHAGEVAEHGRPACSGSC